MDGVEGWRELHRPLPRGGTDSPPARTPFAQLTVTHALSLAGDALVTLALAGSLFFSISPSAARGRVALSLVLTMAPFAVVAPFLGPAIDRSRHGRRAMVVVACGGRAACCLVMAEVLQGLLLFPAAFTLLVLSKAYSVAKSSLVPAAVGRSEELVEANSKLAITGVVAGFAAAAPGVLLLRLVGSRWVLYLAAVFFVAAAVSGFRLRPLVAPLPLPVSQTSPEDGPLAHLGARIDLHLSAAAVAMALLRAMVGFLTFLVAFGFRRTDAPSWWFGLVLAASMAATLAGSVVAPRLREWVSEERILAGCLVLVALTGLLLARVEGRMWAAAMGAATGVSAATGRLAFDSLVQREAPDAVRSRSFARFEAGFQLVWVVGALLPVVVPTPLRQGFDVVGVAALAAAASYVVVQRRLGTAGHGGGRAG